MTNLSLRLNYLSNICSKYHGNFYDLCCDHGKLGMSLGGYKNIDEIYLVDIVPSIINSLKNKATYIPNGKFNIKLEDCTKIKFNTKKEKIITIAGVGGHLTIGILENALPQVTNNDTIILSPHNNLQKVRTYLSQTNLGLVEELLIRDNKKFYEIFVLNNCSKRKIEAVGNFEQTNKLIRYEYYKKNYEYFKIKLKYENSQKYRDLVNRLEKKIKDYG